MAEHKNENVFEKLGRKIEKGFERFGEQVGELGHKMRPGHEEKKEEREHVPSFGTTAQKQALDEHSRLSLAFAEREFCRRRLHSEIEKGKFKLRKSEILHDGSKPFFGPYEFDTTEEKRVKKERRHSKKSHRSSEATILEKKTEFEAESQPPLEMLQQRQKVNEEIVDRAPSLKRTHIEHDASKPMIQDTGMEEKFEKKPPKRVSRHGHHHEREREIHEVPEMWKKELGKKDERELKREGLPGRQLEGEQGRSAVYGKNEVDEVALAEMLVTHLKIGREISDEKVKLKHTSIVHDASKPDIPKDFKLNRAPLAAGGSGYTK